MRTAMFVVVAGIFLLPSISVSADNKDDAVAAFEEGKTLFNDRKFADAAAAFRKAHKLRPNWKLLYNIGQSEAAAKRHGLALQFLEAYLSEGGDDVPETRHSSVMKEVQRLRGMIGTVEVEAPKGSVVFVDGVERGVAPLLGRLPVAASVKHKVWAAIDGEKISEREFQIIGGEILVVKLQKEPSEEAGPKAPIAEPEPTPETEAETETTPVADGSKKEGVSGLLVGGIITTGLGLAGVGVGIYFSTQWNAHVDELADVADKARDAETLEERLEYETEYESARKDLEDEKHPKDKAGMIVGYAAGGALILTGVVLFILDRKKGDKDERVAFAPSPSGLVVQF